MSNRIEEPGYLYVVYDQDRELCKIGTSKKPHLRIRNIVTSSGVRKHKYYTSELAQSPYATERKIHSTLCFSHYRGEWFDCTFERAVQVVDECTKLADDAYLKAYAENLAIRNEVMKGWLEKTFGEVPEALTLKESINRNWGNWVYSEQVEPPKDGQSILAFEFSAGSPSVAYWSERDNAFVCADAPDCEIRVDAWMPIISPLDDAVVIRTYDKFNPMPWCWYGEERPEDSPFYVRPAEQGRPA